MEVCGDCGRSPDVTDSPPIVGVSALEICNNMAICWRSENGTDIRLFAAEAEGVPDVLEELNGDPLPPGRGTRWSLWGGVIPVDGKEVTRLRPAQSASTALLLSTCESETLELPVTPDVAGEETGLLVEEEGEEEGFAIGDADGFDE